MSELLDTEIKFFRGRPEEPNCWQQRQISIHSGPCLLFSYKYVDKTRFYNISELDTDMQYVQIKGKIRRFSTEVADQQASTADFYDEQACQAVWFKGQKWF